MAPMVLDHLRGAPEIFRVFWLTTGVLTAASLFISGQHVITLVKVGADLRTQLDNVFLPPLAALYLKAFLFFPLCALVSWLSLLIIRFTLMLQLLLHLYEVGCMLWFWETMCDFLNGPEAAYQVLHLATSLPQSSITRLMQVTSRMETALLETPHQSRSNCHCCPATQDVNDETVIVADHYSILSAKDDVKMTDDDGQQSSAADDVGDVAAWVSYLRSISLGPYRVLAAFPFCWIPQLRTRRSITKTDLRLSRALVVQYGIFCILSVLARAVLTTPVVITTFQVCSLCSLAVSFYGLLLMLRATRRVVPRAETQLELKLGLLKLLIFLVKGVDMLLRFIPVKELPLYSADTMRGVYMFVAVNWLSLPLILGAIRAYDPSDLTRRYTGSHTCRSGMLVDLLLRLSQRKPRADASEVRRESRLALLCKSLEPATTTTTPVEENKTFYSSYAV